MDSIQNLFIDMNESYDVAAQYIRRFWNLKSVQQEKCANVYIVNCREHHMGKIHLYKVGDELVHIDVQMDLVYSYRGYVRRVKNHYTDYNGQRVFRSVNASAFKYWLIQFMDYCRSIVLTDEMIQDEIDYLVATEYMMELTDDQPHLLPDYSAYDSYYSPQYVE